MDGSRQRFALVYIKVLAQAAFLVLPMLAAGAGDGKVAAFERMIDAHIGQDQATRHPLIEKEYERLFPAVSDESELRRLSDTGLREIFDATDIASFYTGRYVDDLARYFNELARRGQAVNLDYVHLFGAYVERRDFDKAREIQTLGAKQGISFEKLPELEVRAGSDTGHVLLSTRDDEDVLVAEPFDLRHFTGTVVVSHPLCRFSVNAMSAIAAEPAVGGAMRDALWLATQDRQLHFEIIRKWNAEHPARQFHIVYKDRAWKELFAWATPHFYFFREGKLVMDVTGWPAEGNMAAVREGLEKIGLLDPRGDSGG